MHHQLLLSIVTHPPVQLYKERRGYISNYITYHTIEIGVELNQSGRYEEH